MVGVKCLVAWLLTDFFAAYETAWVTPILQKPSFATALTGWRPRKMGLSDGIDVYWVSTPQSRRFSE
jgi:hypothetical protein